MRHTLFIAGGIALLAIILVGGAELRFQAVAHYAPKYEDVRRETFEHTHSFKTGNIRDIENLQLEYVRGNDAEKAAIRSIVRQRLADVDVDMLPVSVRAFAHEMESVN